MHGSPGDPFRSVGRLQSVRGQLKRPRLSWRLQYRVIRDGNMRNQVAESITLILSNNSRSASAPEDLSRRVEGGKGVNLTNKEREVCLGGDSLIPATLAGHHQKRVCIPQARGIRTRQPPKKPLCIRRPLSSLATSTTAHPSAPPPPSGLGPGARLCGSVSSGRAGPLTRSARGGGALDPSTMIRETERAGLVSDDCERLKG